MSGKVHKFQMALSPVWRPLLWPIGVTAESAFAEVSEDDFHVCFGRFFDYHFPVEEVEKVTPGRWPVWAGVGARTNFRGAVGLIGTYVNVVEAVFKEPQRIRMVVPLRCKRLFFSVEDPHAFVSAFRKYTIVEQAKAA
jgi:hypothetical protein